MYSVNLWQSHPENNNDDCLTGADFETAAEAEFAFHHTSKVFPGVNEASHIEIDGPDRYRVRTNPDYVEPVDDNFDDDWRREMAMQAGMGLGIESYNDHMGY